MKGSAPRNDGSSRLDRDGVVRLLIQHEKGLRTYLRLILRDRSLVDDVFQETAVVVMRDAQKKTDAQRFPQWARGVARRVALSFARKEYRVAGAASDLLDQIEGEWEDAVSGLLHEERKDALRACVEALPPASRRLVTLRYYEGLEGPEIAQMLNRSLHGFYVALGKVYRMLSKCIDEKLEPAEEPT